MTVQEYRAYLCKILDRNFFLRKQINALSIIENLYIIEKSPVDEEHLCHFDLQYLWRDYSLKLKKCIYFLEHYCDGLLKEIDCQGNLIQADDVLIPPSDYLEGAIFNFDALILAASAVINYEERDYLVTQFKKAKIDNIYPSKKEIGLYWQLNILRNRIIHHTGGRFKNDGECKRFLDFSSMVQIIRVVHGKIFLDCTQIDVCKEDVKNVLLIAIRSENNVFDELFPYKSGKGHEKKHPTMVVPNKDIYFDHTDAGIKIISQIQDFVCKLNQAFFDEFCYKSGQAGFFSNLCVGLNHSSESDQYQVKDVFECDNE